MKLSRRSLFSLAFAAPAAAAAAPAKAAEPPITMRPTPECCGLPMLCERRDNLAYRSGYRCIKCDRTASIADLTLEEALPVVKRDGNHREVGWRAPAPEVEFTWKTYFVGGPITGGNGIK